MKKTLSVLNKFIPSVLREMNDDEVPHITAHSLRRTCSNVSLFIGQESVYQDVILMHSPQKLADRNYVERDAHSHLAKLTEVNDFIDNRVTEILLNNEYNFGAFDKSPTLQNGEIVNRPKVIDKEKDSYMSGIAFLCGKAKELKVMQGFYFDTWDSTYPAPEFDEGVDL